jgi:hypothetical protein
MSQSGNLTVLIRPCDSGMGPALYSDSSGRVFVQGSKLPAEGRGDLTLSSDEEVVEITPELLAYLKAQN